MTVARAMTAAANDPAAGGSSPAPATGERVLVVDDEADILALVAYHLLRAGYRVSTAGNGAEAIAVAGEDEASRALVLVGGQPRPESLESRRLHVERERPDVDVVGQERRLLDAPVWRDSARVQ